MFDVLLEYPIQSDRSRFSIRPGLERFAARVVTVVRFLPPGGAVRAYEFTGDPGMVPLDPRWHQAALGFIKLGFFHILDGTDHLLFLLCLVIPLRRLRPLLLVVTAFTVAHSITLIASAYGVAPDALWFPPLIETLIAVSIVYMAFENIVGTSSHRRWMIAFGFGLVHGFGFSFALREKLQFAGSHLATSLLSFNIGVELGQLLVLILLIPALEAIVPVRGGGAYGNHHPVGAGGAHRLALDVGARRNPGPLPATGIGRGLPCRRTALAHRDPDPGWSDPACAPKAAQAFRGQRGEPKRNSKASSIPR